MKIIGVIHAKSESKRVIRKNFRLIDSVPLYLIQAINLSEVIPREHIYIDSDNDEIIQSAKMNGFNYIKRPKKFSSNTTGGVKLLEIFAEKVDSDILIQAFPTAPFLEKTLIEQMLKKVISNKFKSSMLIKKEALYKWKNGVADYKFNKKEIPNSVDLEKTIIEIPTLYIVNTKEFKKTFNRTCKPCFQKISDNFSSIDIDNEIDLIFAKSLQKTKNNQDKFSWKNKCRTICPPILFLDVDGTLTDGKYNSSPNGELFKSFSTLDGIATNSIKNYGIKVCIVSASKSSKLLKQRSTLLGVDLITNALNKKDICNEYAEKNGFSLGECAFIGNDINDLEVLESSGLPFCPLDAEEEVKRIAKILPSKGGKGICKSFIEYLKENRFEKRYK